MDWSSEKMWNIYTAEYFATPWTEAQRRCGTYTQWTTCCLVTKLCPTACDLMDCSPPGSSVHGILQARILEWVAISFPRGSSWPRGQTHVSCVSHIGGEFFTVELPGKPMMEYYLALKKEWNNAICGNMDGPRDYLTQWSKPDKGKYHKISLICGI